MATHIEEMLETRKKIPEDSHQGGAARKCGNQQLIGRNSGADRNARCGPESSQSGHQDFSGEKHGRRKKIEEKESD